MQENHLVFTDLVYLPFVVANDYFSLNTLNGLNFFFLCHRFCYNNWDLPLILSRYKTNCIQIYGQYADDEHEYCRIIGGIRLFGTRSSQSQLYIIIMIIITIMLEIMYNNNI